MNNRLKRLAIALKIAETGQTWRIKRIKSPLERERLRLVLKQVMRHHKKKLEALGDE